jgi:hypothetical protein
MPARKQWKFPVEISDKYTPDERKAIAIEIIDFIVDRTQKRNLDKNNRPFKGYSKSYMKSLDFKIAGKNGNVDLTLSGDMMSSIEMLNEKKGKLIIGFSKGLQNDKAEGNILGTYGNKRPVAPARDFLGITTRDLKKEILSKFPIKDREESLKYADKVLTAQQQAEGVTDGEE